MNKTISGTSSISISFDELERLKAYILKNGLKREKVKNQYELLRIKDEKISLIVYKSGKLVHNGSEESKIILREILKSETRYDYMLGSDETGKGEWYGPLVACCVALEPQLLDTMRMMGIRDSKTLSTEQIFDIADKIIKIGPVFKSVILLPETYNKMYADFQKEEKTLNDLLAWAHSRAIKDVLDKIRFKKARLVIDKFDVEKTYRRLYGINTNKIEIIQKSKGESEIPVATASILAKRTFEKTVDELNIKYNINLRKINPKDINSSFLPFVSKIHFKNVSKYL